MMKGIIGVRGFAREEILGRMQTEILQRNIKSPLATPLLA